MNYTENALNIIAAKSFKGIGRAWIVKNLKGKETTEEIVEMLQMTKGNQDISLNDFAYSKEKIRASIQRMEDSCDGITAMGDADFPEFRGNVKESDRPIFLFYKGDIRLLSKANRNISVIGLLNPDDKIEITERIVTEEIARNGCTIVSGLAMGCDSIAHRTALEQGAKTIAILPSPLNSILPAKNKELAYRIAEQGGLLVTEYYENFKNTMELSSRYKERDRLQALYCDAIVLAASYAKDSSYKWPSLSGQKLDSGARLAMAYAKDYGIKRAVIYNNTKHEKEPMYDLNREILAQDGNVIRIDSQNMIEAIQKLLPKNNVKDTLF